MSRTSAHITSRSRGNYVPRYSFDSLFDDDELTLKLLIARHRILMAFDHATYWSHGKMRGTDNFIVGVGERQKDLVKHVTEHVILGMNRSIVTVSDLPRSIDATTSILRRIARDVERRLVAVQVSLMSNRKDIWFDQSVPGYWGVLQSVMDDYRLNRHVTHEAKRVDQRLRRESLHGNGPLMVVH